MNQKFSWVAWRGAQSLSQVTPKIFGSGPFLILQATRKIFRTPNRHVPAGFPHIAILTLTSSYAPKTSNFMIGMLVCWVRIKFGWKLSRQFLGIFFHEKWPIFILFLELWRCQGTQNLWFLKIYMMHNSNYHLFPLLDRKKPPKGVSEQLKVPASSSNLIEESIFWDIFAI